MRLLDFMKTYDLYDLEINKIESINNSLFLYITFDVEQSFMANGCRPEFDYQVYHKFIFLNQDTIVNSNEVQYIKEYKYENNQLTLILTKDIVVLNDCEIEVISNVRI